MLPAVRTGNAQTTIAASYRISRSTVCRIITETCDAIGIVLMRGGFLTCPSTEVEWKEISQILTDNSLKKVNRQVSRDFSLICNWLWANKINLNASKTEIIIFRPKDKQMIKHLNFRISGQKISTCGNVKYLGVILEENLIGIFTSMHLI